MGKQVLVYRFFWCLFFILCFLNFLTVFTPEIGFDALWYHLTLPKLWLFKHQWYFPGGLLYYSVMPRLTEVIFTPLLALLGTSGPKLVQFISGLGICWLIYQMGDLIKLPKFYKIVAINLFYLTFLVSWQSGSAYIDLFRALLENIALYSLLQKRRLRASIFLGLAIGTKWLSLGSLAIFSLIFGFDLLPVSLIVALPWFLIAYFFTQNPVFPIFSGYSIEQNPSILIFIKNALLLPFKLTIPFDDFISPVAGLLISLCAVNYLLTQNTLVKKISLVALFGSLFSVFLNPPSSRFFLPYLPATALSATYLLHQLRSPFKVFLLGLFSLSFLLILSLRIIAFRKNLSYLLGQQTQNQYLTILSSRLPNTFIDSDNYVTDHLRGQKIIIDKIHNLYYFPYDFDHTSWINDYSGYDYLITQDTNPSYINGQLVHTNALGIQVYKLK